MVKFGKKFFFNNAYIKKNRTFTIVIILVILSLIVTTFFITSQFYNNSNKNFNHVVETYESINIKLYDTLPYMLSYFKKLENTKLSDIKIAYPDNFSYIEDTSNCTAEQIEIINGIKTGEITNVNVDEAFSCMIYKANTAGSYTVKITIDKKDYHSVLNVIDDEAPQLIAKNFEIFEDENYSINDFVSSCTDNSQKDCQVKFLNTSLVDYSNYKEPGTYDIKIAAYDYSNNRSEPVTVTLTIKKIIYYTVNFNTQGGSNVESQTIREGDTINYPNTPTRSGYIFKGWYYNNKEYDISTPVTSDMTIVAQWEKIKTSSGGGTGGGGGSYSGGGSGGGSSNTCVKYNDVYEDVSIYNYQFSGGSAKDCMNKTSYLEAAKKLRDKYRNEIVEDYKYFHLNGKYCNGTIHTEKKAEVVRYNNLIVGYKLSIVVTCAGSNAVTYEFHCSSKDKCSYY